MVHHLFTRKFWHELFEVGVFLKVLNALWEGGSGLGLLLLTHTHVRFDHDDILFNFVTRQLHTLSISTRNFVGIYLLAHSIINLFLAYNLYKNRIWAYPLAAAIVALFSVYQVYRIFHTHSLILAAVTIFDIAFVILTWHEYRFQRHLRHHHVSSLS